ncbi:MAG: hydrolase [Gammaproteobacteria bacterium]|nr:hydrolase [Gammaproteobacteria bacterium]
MSQPAADTFTAAWWCRNPHLQTLTAALFPPPKPLPHHQRERFETEDGDFFDVDRFDRDNSRPLVILLHGLAGSASSPYILRLHHTLDQAGFSTVALNLRGCSGCSNRLARSYHSGDTADLHQLYRSIRASYPQRRVAAVGFSLGGNILLKWLGEQGDHLTLDAAAAVSVPYDLALCADHLDKGLSRFYRNHLITLLQRGVAEKLDLSHSPLPPDQIQRLRQLGDLSSLRSFNQFDHQITAPLNGFMSGADYYRRSSCCHYLGAITTPTLLIHGEDDPIVPARSLPLADQLPKCVTLELSRKGGHVGFVAGESPLRPRFWLNQRITHFLNHQLHLFTRPIKNLPGLGDDLLTDTVPRQHQNSLCTHDSRFS